MGLRNCDGNEEIDNGDDFSEDWDSHYCQLGCPLSQVNYMGNDAPRKRSRMWRRRKLAIRYRSRGLFTESQYSERIPSRGATGGVRCFQNVCENE